MAQYVNIMVDGGFKAVFQHKEVTIDFINATLEGERKVTNITYIDKEIRPESMENRTIIFDLLCEDQDKSLFILEMQNYPQSYFLNRGFYYLCRMISRQGEIGDRWKYDLLPVYGIYLLNFELPEISSYRTDIIMADEKTGKPFTAIKMKQIYISFPLFNLKPEECDTSFKRRIYALKNMNIYELSPFKEEAEAFQRLLNVANLNALTPQERAEYDENLKNYRDWQNTIDYAVEDGVRKGMEKGMKEGIKEGMREGMKEAARKLKQKGFPWEEITEVTGLSASEIEAL